MPKNKKKSKNDKPRHSVKQPQDKTRVPRKLTQGPKPPSDAEIRSMYINNIRTQLDEITRIQGMMEGTSPLPIAGNVPFQTPEERMAFSKKMDRFDSSGNVRQTPVSPRPLELRVPRGRGMK